MRLILEAQEEAVAYHTRNMATYGAMGPDMSLTSPAPVPKSQYPEDPFPRSFWAMFFLISPTAALMWFNVVDLTLEGLLVCAWCSALMRNGIT